MVAGGAEASGFQVWFANFVQYAGPILQMMYWLVLIVVAVWAVLLFKRWVDFQTGRVMDADEVEVKRAKSVKVEEFVE